MILFLIFIICCSVILPENYMWNIIALSLALICIIIYKKIKRPETN